MSKGFLPIACALGVFAGGCSSSSSSDAPSPPADAGHHDAQAVPPAADAGTLDAFAGAATEHGTILDYGTLKPQAGLTVTDNGMSATTDDAGAFSLMVPAGSKLTPQVTGPSYTHLLFPESLPAAADVDFGTLVMPASSIFMLEQVGLSNKMTQALVQIVVVTAPTCASAVGGTLDVVSPPGTSFAYFSSDSLPDGTVTSFAAVTPPRPVAVVYNVTPGAPLDLQITHPTCKQAAFPFTYQGKIYTGDVPTKATEPGDYNSAMVMMLE